MRKTHPAAEAYIRGVLRGKIQVGRLARLAIERHVHDLQRWPARNREEAAKRGDPYYFDPAAAWLVLDFYGLCVHVEGELAGQVFEPLPFQAAVDWISHGWMRTATGKRRYRERWIEMPRGNGKSYWLSCHELYMLLMDGEPGAKNYALATEKVQAAEGVWGVAAEICRRSPELSAHVIVQDSINSHRIFVPGDNCIFQPLKSDPRKADQLNPHSIACDEMHEWPKRELYTKLKTAMGKRTQPMLTAITTAGDDRTETLYDELHDYAIRVLEGWKSGQFEDDEFFAIVYAADSANEGADADDDPYDERTWRKANPALGAPGASVRIEHLRAMANRAKVSPETERDFLRLHLGRRVAAKTKAISTEQWDACAASAADGPIGEALARGDWSYFRGRRCWAGLDLSSTRDLTALALYFPPTPEWPYETYRYYAWLPEDNLEEARDRDHAPYDAWVRDGWLQLTPGNEIDDSVILAAVKDVAETYDVVEWAYDPWHATSLKNRLYADTGIEMIKFVQDLPSFGEPTRLYLDAIATGKKRHDGNPLARWCAGNVVTKEDAHGNKRPHKRLSHYRIDPIVAAIMARGRAIVETAVQTESVYESYHVGGGWIVGPGSVYETWGEP